MGLFFYFFSLKLTHYSFISRNTQGKWKSRFYYTRNPSHKIYFWPESNDNFLLKTEKVAGPE